MRGPDDMDEVTEGVQAGGGRSTDRTEVASPGAENLLDSLGSAAYVSDERGCIIGVNHRAEELLARPPADLLGQDAHDLLHRTRNGESVPRTQCRFREAELAGRTAQGDEAWLERGDGTLAPVAWLATPCDTGDGAGTTIVLFHPVGEEPPAGPEPHHRPLSERERLALLAETTTQLSATLEVEEAVRRLVALLAPRLADWVVVDVITERDQVWRYAVVHAEDGEVVSREDLEGPMPPVPQESPMPLSRALRGAASALARPETYAGPPDSGIAVEQRRLFEATGMHSAVIAPIPRLRKVLGALTLGRSERQEPFTASDITLVEDIARRAGLSLDNARLYQRQRKVAETMQHHLLPQLPRVPELEMAARYLAAPDASQVGGDWYDAFTLPDGAMALAVGDVVGHDLDAAAGMAQLRNMLRAYTWSQQGPPSRIVEWLDEAAQHIAEPSMATLVLARLTVADDGTCQLSWTNAGHPPPLLISRDGLARYLNDGHDVLLGAGDQEGRPDATVEMPPGSTLLLYTDGLIESPAHSLEHGMEELRRHAAYLAHRPLGPFTDHLLARARPSDNEDDVALLLVRATSR